jgi:tape measure domain-containing protein
MAEKELIFDIVVETNKAVADIKGMLAKTEAEAKKSGSKAGNEFVKGIKGEIANLKIDILQGMKIDKGRIDSLRNQINQGLLEAKITPTQAYSMLSQLESASKKVGDKLETNLKSAGSKGGMDFATAFKVSVASILTSAVIISMFSSLSGAIKEYSNDVFSSALNTEYQAQAFTTLTGSAEKSKKLFEDINKLSLETPFNVDDLRQIAKSILSYGIALEDVIPTTKMLGDISAGTGGDLLLLAKAYGQVKTKGKLYAQELNQLGEQGLAVREILAKKLGVSIENLMKGLETGKITVDFQEFSDVIQGIHKGKFLDFMAKQATTAKGRMQNLGEQLNLVGQEILGIDTATGKIKPDSLFDRMTKSLAETLDFISQNKESIIAFGISLGNAIGDGITKIKELGKLLITGDFTGGFAKAFGVEEDSKIVDIILDIREAFVKVGTEIGKIPEKLEAMSKWYGDNKSWIENLAGVLGGIATGFTLVYGAVAIYNGVIALATAVTTGFGAVLAFVTAPIFLIALAIGAVIAIGFLLWKNWDFLMEKAKEFGDFVSKKFTEIKDDTIENFTKMKDDTVKKFTEIKDSVVGFLTKMKDDSVKKITEMKDGIVNIWTEFVDFITDPNKIIYAIGYLVGFIVKQWVDTFIFVKDTAVFAFNSIVGFIMGIPAVLGAFWEFIKQQGASAWEFIKTTATNSFNALIGFIVSIPYIVATTFENLKNGAIQKFEELKNGTIQTLENLKNDFVQKFEDIKKFGSDKITEMKDTIVNTFNSLKDINLYDVGKEIIQSLINGIGSKANDLKNTILGLGDSFKAGFGAGFSGQAYADGGLVKGKNVFALLNDGDGQEFVMNAGATRQFLPLLKAMNNGGNVSNVRNDNQNINSNNNVNYNNYGNKENNSTLPFMLNYA